LARRSLAGSSTTRTRRFTAARRQFVSYLGTGHFWEATGENWESEFLQMALFVLLTMCLYQKGSAESKRIGVVEEVDLDPRGFKDQKDAPGPVKRGGWELRLYENSLGLAFSLLFVLSFAMHAAGGLLAGLDLLRVETATLRGSGVREEVLVDPHHGVSGLDLEHLGLKAGALYGDGVCRGFADIRCQRGGDHTPIQ